MMKATHARYTLEFKQEAVRLVESGESIAVAARTLGLQHCNQGQAPRSLSRLTVTGKQSGKLLILVHAAQHISHAQTYTRSGKRSPSYAARPVRNAELLLRSKCNDKILKSSASDFTLGMIDLPAPLTGNLNSPPVSVFVSAFARNAMLGAKISQSFMVTVFTSEYCCSPYSPSSRPVPDCLNPPNGARVSKML